MSKETTLSQCSQRAQAFVLAQLTRNQYAIDYWMAALSTLKEMPMYRHKIKQMYNNIVRDVEIYNNHVRNMIHVNQGDTIDGYDVMLDNTAEFHDDMKKQVYFYEQAISRIIQKRNTPHASWLCKLGTAKDILDIVAFVDGLENRVEPSIGNICNVIGLQRDMPHMQNEQYKSSPTVMGYFVHVASKMNMAIINELGIDKDIAYSPETDAESFRSIDIVAHNFIEAIMDYKTLMVMYEDEGGKTVKEAREISNARLREAEEKLKRDAEKKAHREEIKKAKAECKQ